MNVILVEYKHHRPKPNPPYFRTGIYEELEDGDAGREIAIFTRNEEAVAVCEKMGWMIVENDRAER